MESEPVDHEAAEDVRAAFRAAMAHMACPVSVATAMDALRPHGTTVSAVMSLSMEPELFLISLNRSSDLLRVVERTGRFGVNILAEDQDELGHRFAKKGPSKFVDVEWRSREGLPRIIGVSAWLACSVRHAMDQGDHTVLVGAVEDVEVDLDRAPLVYQGRRFSRTTAL